VPGRANGRLIAWRERKPNGLQVCTLTELKAFLIGESNDPRQLKVVGYFLIRNDEIGAGLTGGGGDDPASAEDASQEENRKHNDR